MKGSKIKQIKAREILDSRGSPTIEVELTTNFAKFLDSVPSGASRGKYEAKELRDEGKRYQGKGVLKAVKNVNEIIGPKLVGKNPIKQKEIDELLMIGLDGTENKSKLGANSILAVSLACCRAGAGAKNIPLYQHISQLFEIGSRTVSLPIPCFNIINGGVHAGNDLSFQEFMIVPQNRSFSRNLETASEIYQGLKEILEKNFGKGATNLGDEGGFAPSLRQTQQALNLIIGAIKSASRARQSRAKGEDEALASSPGYSGKVKIGLDCAASQFFKNGNYQLEGTTFTRAGFLNFYQDLIKNYPILFLEDPFSEEDFEGFREITKKLSKKIVVIGDDLLATNPGRIKKAKEEKACNGAIIKLNQIGTVSEALEAVKLAKSFGWKIMVSHRSGETLDDFISDFAVGISADFIKAGAPARGERVAKYNRLLRTEEELAFPH